MSEIYLAAAPFILPLLLTLHAALWIKGAKDYKGDAPAVIGFIYTFTSGIMLMVVVVNLLDPAYRPWIAHVAFPLSGGLVLSHVLLYFTAFEEKP